jgi:hypothetical protein
MLPTNTNVHSNRDIEWVHGWVETKNEFIPILKRQSGWSPQSYGVVLPLIHYNLLAYVFTTYLDPHV